MKRKFTILTAALALFFMFSLQPMKVWADNVTILPSDGTPVTSSNYTITKDPITVSVTASTLTTDQIRVFKNKTLTVSSEATITGIEFTCTASGTSQYGPGCFTTTSGYTYEGSVGTWSGSSNSVTFTASTNQVRVTQIVVTYTSGGNTVATPTFNPANGTTFGDEGLSVEISCATENTTIYYTLDGSEPDDESLEYTGAISLTETTTIKAIAFDSDDNTSAVATATYTYVDPNAPGTANNPYTVAQALAANPATGVYVHGIISTITEVSTQHGNATYKISDDGTTSGEMIVYRGKYLDNAAFTSEDQIQLGDEVVVTGELKLYSGANQLTTGNYIVSLVRPEPTVAAPVFAPAAGTYLGTQDVTITCATSGSAIYYTTDGSTPTNESTLYNGAIAVSETTTIKAIAYVGTDASSVVTANYIIEQPLTTIQAILDVATSTSTAHYITFNNYIVTGKNSNGHQAFATDGVNGFVLYNGSGDMGFVAGDVLSGTLQCNVQLFGESAEIIGISSTTEGLTVTPNGTVTAVETTIGQLAPINTGSVVTLNNLTYNGSALSDGTNTINPYNTMYEGTFENGSSYNITGVFFYNSGNKRIMPRGEEDIVTLQPVQTEAVYNYSINGVEGEEVFDSFVGSTITLADGQNINDDYTFAGWTTNASNVNERLTGSYTLTEEVTTFYAVYAHTTGATGGDPVYEKVAGLSDIVSGEYVIVSDGYYLQNEEVTAKNGFPCDGKTVTVVDNNLTNVTSDMLWTFSGNNETMSITAGEYYLYTVTDNNGLRNTTNNNPGTWLFAVNGNGFSMKYSETNRYCGIYVANDVHTNWRSYTSANATNYADGGQLYLYKKVGGGTPATTNYYTIVKFKEVAAYQGAKDGYVLVASPVSTTPAAAGMITDDLGAQATPETATYDLYSFDQAEDLEWINYRQGGFNTIDPGKGYLYASKEGVTLTFAGTTYTGNGKVTLHKTEGGDFPGWNLVGNPYAVEANIGNRDFYVMNTDGDLITEGSGNIAPMQGIFVIAETDSEELTFSTGTASTGGEKIVMNLGRNGNTIDRAIVRFGEGRQLPKFQLNENSTKLYITEDNQDFAVVRSAAEGEMPVSFKAENNGTYTISVNAEDIDMEYLHLIDNMTGADIDLLKTPSYSFNAKVTDYANRFRLMFRANDSENNNAESFAFYNNGNITVNGNGILNIVDVLGRTVLTQELTTANCQLSTANIPAGVYTLQLVNGDKVKTQKVVVK